MSEYKKLSKEPWTNIELVHDNIHEWIVALIVLNPDSQYYGGYFKAQMKFPTDYPYNPPEFRLLRPLFHPNVYPDGKLCISILHPPGDDETSGETAAERWSPAQSVESVLISILSLLDDAEVTGPANVDAGVMMRKQPERYKEMVKKDLEASKKDIPEGFVMPTHQDAFGTKKEDEYVMSWDDSDAENDFDGSDFGGSDSGVVDEEDEESPTSDMEEDDADDADDAEEEVGGKKQK